MKSFVSALLAGSGVLAISHAAPLVHEPFAYQATTLLTGLAGGTGWPDAWTVDGASASVAPVGLNFSDSAGNVLSVSGLATTTASTASTATTRSLRTIAATDLNSVWISFLYQLPASNVKFEGVSFYRGTQQLFTISNPSTTTNAGIYLTNHLVAGATVSTGRGTFGQTHLVVLKLTKAGGAGGVDRAEVFIDPILTSTPVSLAATVDGANFDFNRVRIAGQDGSALLVDELRIGESFGDVTPHVSAPNQDPDGDGLTNAQETILGLNPSISDATLIAGIQAHPDWFSLHTASGILELANGGVILQRNSNDLVGLIFDIQQSDDLAHWGVLETINRWIELPAGKNFLRLKIDTP